MIESKPTTPTNADGAGDRLNGAAKNGTLPVSVEADEEYTYLFPYREPSSYSHVVDLIRQYVPSEVIVDLGAGAGTIGEPLQNMGFTYIGVEKHRGRCAFSINATSAIMPLTSPTPMRCGASSTRFPICRRSV